MTQAISTGSGPAAAPSRTINLEGMASLLIALLAGGLLANGWISRTDPSINPEHGFGYALGIAGGSMMLLLLVYPLRKRIRILSAIGSVGFWFRFHMLLGLLGPIAILYHSRFSWGALNSAVALAAMLVVSGSGLIGRYFYSRIHRGYSGRKLEVRALLQEMHSILDGLAALGQDGAAVRARIEPFEQKTVSAGAAFWASARSVFVIGIGTRFAERHLRREIAQAHAPGEGVTSASIKGRERLMALSHDYFDAVRRAAEFAFYDRMFRLWHLLHLPLFLILVATAIIHIIAVHMY